MAFLSITYGDYWWCPNVRLNQVHCKRSLMKSFYLSVLLDLDQFWRDPKPHWLFWSVNWFCETSDFWGLDLDYFVRNLNFLGNLLKCNLCHYNLELLKFLARKFEFSKYLSVVISSGLEELEFESSSCSKIN